MQSLIRPVLTKYMSTAASIPATLTASVTRVDAVTIQAHSAPMASGISTSASIQWRVNTSSCAEDRVGPGGVGAPAKALAASANAIKRMVAQRG